jgi:hypothetical protein
MHHPSDLEEMETMASREAVRSSPVPPPSAVRSGTAIRPGGAVRDERSWQTTLPEPLEAHWVAAIDAATD